MPLSPVRFLGTLAVAACLAVEGPALAAQIPAAGDAESVEAQRDRLAAIRQVSAALARDDSLSAELRTALQQLLAVLENEAVAPGAALASLQRLTVRADEHEHVLDQLAGVVENLSVYGDVRLRQETDLSRDDAPTRNRQRVRLRLGATLAVSDELAIGARLVTGDSGDPRSSHQTLGNGFDSFEVSLDRVFADYHPESRPDLWLRAGKFGHAFRSNPVYGELVWDADVQPEGVALGYRASDLLGLDQVDFVAGKYLISEQSVGGEASAFVAQVSSRAAVATAWDLLTALGYYHFSRLSPSGSTTVTAANGGNAIAADGDFSSRFSMLNPIVALTNTSLDAPLTFSCEYIANTRVEGPHGSGWAIGTAYGKTESAGDWRTYYQYQDIEQDAVLTPFAQDDFLRASGFEGHVAGWQYQFEDDVQLHVWGLVTRRQADIPTTATERHHQWRVRVDLNIRF